MSDAYGSGAIPAEVPEEGAAIGDPLLDKLLEFFAAIVVRECAAAWDAASGNIGNQSIVKRVFAHNPGDQAFRELTTPAMYLWRDAIGTAVWRAADYRIRPSNMTLRWVPFMANSQDAQRRWSPIMNAVCSAIDLAIERGRDPGWIREGDDDPMADTLGSFFYSYASLWKLEMGAARRVMLSVPIEGQGPPRTFPAVDIPLLVEERLLEDREGRANLPGAKYPDVSYVDTAIVVPAEPPTLPLALPTNMGRFS